MAAEMPKVGDFVKLDIDGIPFLVEVKEVLPVDTDPTHAELRIRPIKRLSEVREGELWPAT